jgi:glycosyltransferase involved in cell wall biosynthesis
MERGGCLIAMDRKPMVVVVTPVYNTGRYLEEAIQSVLAQTYDNWRYLISNNHSTDETAEIAARYAALDNRISVVSPPTFLAQGQHFNFALGHVGDDADYCKILLADDMMMPGCLEAMVQVAESDPDVVLVSSYRVIETAAANFGLPIDTTVIPGRVAGRLHLIGGVYPIGTPSSVMYRGSVVRQRNPAFFPADRYYFDTDVAFRIMLEAKFGFVHQVLTFSRYQPDSITHREATLYSGELDGLICVSSYGQDYLDADEYRRAISRARRSYFEKLGREWLLDRFRGRRDDFWEYHRVRLASAGLTIERSEVVKGAVRAVGRAIGSPGEVVTRVRGRHETVGDAWAQ